MMFISTYFSAKRELFDERWLSGMDYYQNCLIFACYECEMKGEGKMSSKLQALFSDVLSSTEKVLKETEAFDHPLLTLVRTAMEEQKENLQKLLPELKDEEEAKLAAVKEEISIVYHCHEVANPLFSAWGRANEWMDLPSKPVVKKLKPLFPEMKKNLEEAAMELENIYGEEEIKFVVPTFYIPTIR